jgi:hypothetical protein
LQEQKRLELEREERERKRQENEIQQIKDRHLKEKMQQISQTSHGQKILKKLNEDVSHMNPLCIFTTYLLSLLMLLSENISHSLQVTVDNIAQSPHPLLRCLSQWVSLHGYVAVQYRLK